mmetsp:Transcript_40092/g.55711  ORF Transcript_40092/g.55711 Transcript_40092/m.55711 type:complete len:203 (+) Transcript_40092:130-738(+)|eukprot:CAMPEP_0196594702 /NCGR_PEP_ID=MMETSP1081-20130531/79039_1 /TAXON_ID=36882 /ORGANISM="Pyramimonas amylifera, Strain CCMP720" /LENGTH=202 /DNA_ID=CAMNT_0041919029 /DNA_START=117 /DNA_END=725 /DNA_ORIENTATION=+
MDFRKFINPFFSIALFQVFWLITCFTTGSQHTQFDSVADALNSYTGLTSEGNLKAAGVRDFLLYLRKLHKSSQPSTRFLDEFHANQLLHMLRSAGGLPVGKDVTPQEIQAAFESAPEAFQQHVLPSVPPEGSACDGLPPHILKRKGSCELKRLRHKLESTKNETPLFDTRRWVSNFEIGLQMMWEIYHNGLGAMHIFVHSEL